MNFKKQKLTKPQKYINFINQLKTDIQHAQLRAALSVTHELTLLYWRIGKQLSQKIKDESWGSKTLDKVSYDIRSSFPDISGFSSRNLYYMRRFAEAYPSENHATAVAQIPWGHNIALLEKIEGLEKRLWYAQQTLENGWSRSILITWIDSSLYERQGKAVTNFKKTLPSPLSDLAEQTLKDPYNFSFLSLDKMHREQELEQGLADHIQKFLTELGQGFAFVNRQQRLEIAGKDYYIDLLFYHLKLRCYVVVELKATAFDPRDAGQMSFYLSAVDDLLRHPDDQPTIGMILCQTKERVVVEYALRDNLKPIGVASYETKIMESLPDNLKGSLPTVEEIEAEFTKRSDITPKKI